MIGRLIDQYYAHVGVARSIFIRSDPGPETEKVKEVKGMENRIKGHAALAPKVSIARAGDTWHSHHKVSMSGGWKYSLYSHCLFILAEKSDHISFWSYKMTKTNLGHSFIPKIHISSGCFI